jgi:hypothetical protein
MIEVRPYLLCILTTCMGGKHHSPTPTYIALTTAGTTWLPGLSENYHSKILVIVLFLKTTSTSLDKTSFSLETRQRLLSIGEVIIVATFLLTILLL